MLTLFYTMSKIFSGDTEIGQTSAIKFKISRLLGITDMTFNLLKKDYFPLHVRTLIRVYLSPDNTEYFPTQIKSVKEMPGYYEITCSTILDELKLVKITKTYSSTNIGAILSDFTTQGYLNTTFFGNTINIAGSGDVNITEIIFKDTTLYDAILELVNITEASLGIKYYFSETNFVQVTQETFIQENVHFATLEAEQDASSIINTVRIFRAKSASQKENEYVSSATDATSILLYGDKTKDVLLPNYYNATECAAIAANILDRVKDPANKLKAVGMFSFDPLKLFALYHIRGRFTVVKKLLSACVDTGDFNASEGAGGYYALSVVTEAVPYPKILPKYIKVAVTSALSNRKLVLTPDEILYNPSAIFFAIGMAPAVGSSVECWVNIRLVSKNGMFIEKRITNTARHSSGALIECYFFFKYPIEKIVTERALYFPAQSGSETEEAYYAVSLDEYEGGNYDSQYLVAGYIASHPTFGEHGYWAGIESPATNSAGFWDLSDPYMDAATVASAVSAGANNLRFSVDLLLDDPNGTPGYNIRFKFVYYSNTLGYADVIRETTIDGQSEDYVWQTFSFLIPFTEFNDLYELSWVEIWFDDGLSDEQVLRIKNERRSLVTVTEGLPETALQVNDDKAVYVQDIGPNGLTNVQEIQFTFGGMGDYKFHRIEAEVPGFVSYDGVIEEAEVTLVKDNLNADLAFNDKQDSMIDVLDKLRKDSQSMFSLISKS